MKYKKRIIIVLLASYLMFTGLQEHLYPSKLTKNLDAMCFC